MRQYEMIELVFPGKEPEGSHVAVDLQAVITGPTSQVTVKGFYAGADTYKLRFLPEEAGQYQIKVSGIVNEELTLDVETAAEGQHGVVRAEGTHLQHADGTYITTFGTTIYGMAHQTDELVEETFESLAGAPFNKLRMCVFPKHYDYNRNEPKYFAFKRVENAEPVEFHDNLGAARSVQPIDVNHPDYDFWNDFEAKLERLFAMGIQVDLILFHPYDRWGHSHMPQADNLIYLDYALRRLAAYPGIWWSMANEYDLFFDWKREQWHEIDEFIAKNDPYHHLLSNHNCFALYDFEREAVTHCSIQVRLMNRVAELQKKFSKPVCYDECAYEGNLKQSWGSISAKEMTNRFWQATVTGGFCTHGEVLLDDDIVTQEQQDNAVLWWAKGGKLKGESPKRIAFLREIVESLPGPIDPYESGFAKILNSDPEELRAMLPHVPEHMRGFVGSLLAMDPMELFKHSVMEYSYAGHVGEETYLFYYGTDCFARVSPELPAGKNYRIEVIDTWNMTRETVCEDYQPVRGAEIRLPGHEYMALIATVVS